MSIAAVFDYAWPDVELARTYFGYYIGRMTEYARIPRDDDDVTIAKGVMERNKAALRELGR